MNMGMQRSLALGKNGLTRATTIQSMVLKNSFNTSEANQRNTVQGWGSAMANTVREIN